MPYKPKRSRIPMDSSPVFAMRGGAVKWPTLRGAYLNKDNILSLRKTAWGVVFLEGPYNTLLNFDNKDSLECAVFFEHLIKVDGDALFLLIWVGNYHAGAIFHCAWQFPQCTAWPQRGLEYGAKRVYRQVANILYGTNPKDPEVEEFLNHGDTAGNG
jgi:hypothetical protein